MRGSPPFRRLILLNTGGVDDAGINSLYFDGVNDEVDCGDDASVMDLHAGAFTVDVLWRVPDLSGVGDTIFGLVSQGDWSADGWALIMQWVSGNLRPMIAIEDGGGTWRTTGPVITGGLPAGTLIYIRGRRDSSGNLHLHYTTGGGVTTSSSGPWTGATSADDNLLIGKTSVYVARGNFLYVHIWDSDKAALSEMPTAPLAVDADTAARYRFVEGANAYLDDDSGNGNAGWITGAAWEAVTGANWTPGDVRSYATILRDLGADEVWPLVDIASGTNIPAFVNSNRDGTLQGWDLQDEPGPVSGTAAPYSDGVNDYGNITTSNGSDGLADIFDGGAWSMFIWGKIPEAAWTDGQQRHGIHFNAGADNYLLLRKSNSNNRLDMLARVSASFYIARYTYVAGGTTDWFSFGASGDTAANELKLFVDGEEKEGVTYGTFVGTPSIMMLLAQNVPPSVIWQGHAAYAVVKFGSVFSPWDFKRLHEAAFTAGADE